MISGVSLGSDHRLEVVDKSESRKNRRIKKCFYSGSKRKSRKEATINGETLKKI